MQAGSTKTRAEDQKAERKIVSGANKEDSDDKAKVGGVSE